MRSKPKRRKPPVLPPQPSRHTIPPPEESLLDRSREDLDQWLDDLVNPAKCETAPQLAKALARWVTRDDAQQWLLHVPKYQRDKKSRSLHDFFADMRDGYWVNGVAVIAFDRMADLINGQHVLAAFLEAFLASAMQRIFCIVVVNRDPDAYLGYDLGMKRSLADNLKGETESPGAVGRVLSVLAQWDEGIYTANDGKGYIKAREGKLNLRGRRGRELLAAMPGIEKHLFRNPFRTNGGDRSLAAMHAASYRLHQIDPEKAPIFFRRFITGEDLSQGDPILALRCQFQNMNPDERWRSGPTLAQMLTAWNLFVSKSKITRWPFRMGISPFPEVAGPLPIPESSRASASVH